jgi:hypothetical protein
VQTKGPAAAGTGRAAVQRQIVLPLSKAVEIAYKNIRMRLSRSLLVTSGIILALAFLMSINANDAIIDGMRNWSDPAPGTAMAEKLKRDRATFDRQMQTAAVAAKELHDKLQEMASKPPALPEGKSKLDPVQALGATFEDLKKELGNLPGSDDALLQGISADPQFMQTMKGWMQQQREWLRNKQELTAPETLAAMMKGNGVPTTQAEIENNRIQTRWMLGLALLVAFVGILNAMLMSVTERFREIGTMKCLGALDSFIIKLFLIESLFQGTIGTVLGIAIGLLLSIGATASTYGGYMWRMFPTGQVALGAGVCLLVGMGLTVAGAVDPAWQAARMQPIDAMRVET